MSGAERGAFIRELVAQALWPGKGVHPARRCDARQLFEALNEQPKSHVQHREEGELHVFHYNQKVQNTCAWTPELLLARGLIFRRNARTKETTLVATPWPKFFNLQEDGYELEELAEMAKGGRVEVTTKMDGSLGLVFHDGKQWRVTTKGSFSSDQARWATAWLKRNVDAEALQKGATYLVEIIYRENQIVIPYPFQQLVLLSAFSADGRELSREELAKVAEASRPKVLRDATAKPEPQPAPEPEPEPALTKPRRVGNHDQPATIGAVYAVPIETPNRSE